MIDIVIIYILKVLHDTQTVWINRYEGRFLRLHMPRSLWVYLLPVNIMTRIA